MCRLLPSASVISGLPTVIRPKRILNFSMLWGMMVGSASLFSSITSCRPFSRKLLKERILLSTNFFSSKYFLIRMDLSTGHHPIIDGNSSRLAAPLNGDNITFFDGKFSQGRVIFNNFRQGPQISVIRLQQLLFFSIADLAVWGD